jgi:hypothetical protein
MGARQLSMWPGASIANDTGNDARRHTGYQRGHAPIPPASVHCRPRQGPASEGIAMSALGFWARFVLAILATWRVTHLLASEDGPADLIVRFRALLGKSVAGSLMDCFNCVSLWIAAPAALFVSRTLGEWFFSWLALSGGACLLERFGHESAVIEPVPQPFEGELDHVLRSETVGDGEQSDETNGSEHSAKRHGSRSLSEELSYSSPGSRNRLVL